MQKLYSIFLFLICFAFFSCRELVTDQFPHYDPKPVVNAVIVANDTMLVHLSCASSIGTEPLAVIENAIVEISDSSGYAEVLEYNGDGIYKSQTTAVAGATYYIVVKVAGFETVTAQCTVPNAQQIVDVVHVDIAGVNDEGATYPSVSVTFTNNPTETQYFEIVLRLLQYDSEMYAELINVTDPIIMNEGINLAMFSNSMCVDSVHKVTLNYTTNHFNMSTMELFPLIVEFRTIDLSYYQYCRQLYLYQLGRYPEAFSGNVSPTGLYSNVKNGLGIFGAYSAVVADTIFPTHDIR